MAELTAQQLELLAKSARETAAMLEEVTRASGPKAEADRQAAEQADKAAESLKYWTGVIGRSAVDFQKNLLTGGEGTAKFGSTITGATDAAGNALGNITGKFGLLGMAAGGLIKIFGQVAAASLKQNDNIMKAYRDLADAGSVSGSLEKLKDDLGTVGLTSEEYEKFGSLIKKYTPAIADFGGSVTAGKDKLVGVIGSMIGPNSQIERSMARLGYSAEDMRDATSDYIAKQTRMGLSQNKTQDQLRDGSVRYMETLRELQELTGMQRDEAQKIIDQQMNEYRYNEYLRQLELSGKEADAERLRTYIAGYQKEFGATAAHDLMEQIVQKGAAATEGSIRAQLSTQGQAYKQAMAVQDGTTNMGRAMLNTMAGMDRNMKQLGPSYNYLGQQMKQQTGDNEQLIGMQKLRGKTEEDIARRIAENQEDQDDRLGQNVKMEQQQRAMRVAADRALWEVGNATVSMFEKLTQIMFKFGKFLAQVIDFISPVVLRKKTNLSASFRDNEDVQRDKTVALKEREQLVAEKARLEKDLEGNGIDKAALTSRIREQQFAITAMQREASNLKGEDLAAAQLKIAEKQRALREDEQLVKDIGRGDKETILQNRKKRLLEVEERLQSEDKRLQELEKENIQTGGTPTAPNNTNQVSNRNMGPATKFEGNQKEFYDQVYTKLLAEAKSQKVANPEAIARLGASQASLETGYGKHMVGNNYFGIKDFSGKGNKASTQEWDPAAGRMVTRQESFRGYQSGDESIRDYIQFLKTNKRYEGVLAAKTPEEAIRAQGKTGYATDPNYGSKLANIHERSQLPKAADGGLFNGPKSGYPVLLHGREAVVPMPNVQTFMDDVKKESLSTLANKTTTDTTTPIATPKIDLSGLEKLMADSFMTKFEDMIDQLESANDTLKNILTHAKA